MSPNRNDRGVLPLCAASVALLLVFAACTSDDPVAESAGTDADTSPTTALVADDEISAAGETAGDQAAGEFGTVEEYLDGLNDHGYEGMVLIREGEDETVRSYGFADREAELGWDTTTVFDIGSITKQFTGAAIVRLEMDGLLAVDDTLADHLDGLPPEIGAITLHQLLTHTAGFPGGLGDDYAPIGREEYIALAVDAYAGQPGEAFSYSNTGYSLLGAVIESATGDSYEVYLREALFEPAGMTNTGYVLPDWSDDVVAVGYGGEEAFGRPNDQTWDIDGPYWHLRANGGILSTVEDMMRWHEALLNDDVLDDAAKEKFFGMHVAEDPGSPFHYGYGWTVAETPDHGTLITHNGGNGVFFADFLRFVDEDITIFVATNNAPDSGEGTGVGLALAALGTDPFAAFEPGDDRDDDDGGGNCGLGFPTRAAVLADLDETTQLDEFPDTEQGRVAAEFMRLMIEGGTDAEFRRFVDDHVSENLIAPDESSAAFGEYVDEFGGATITHIIEVGESVFRIITEDANRIVGIGFRPGSPHVACFTISD